MNLSQSRADSVRAYLVAHGIDPSRLVVEGLRHDEAARAEQHRREPRPEPPRAVHSHRVVDVFFDDPVTST